MRKNKFGNKPSGGGEKPNSGWGKGGDGGGFKKKKFKPAAKPFDPDAPPGEQKEETNRDMETVEDGLQASLNCRATYSPLHVDAYKLDVAYGFSALTEGRRVGWLVNMQPVRENIIIFPDIFTNNF